MSTEKTLDVSALGTERRERPSQPIVMHAATPMEILSQALQKGVDTETLDKLMALQERWEANQARKAFEAAIAEAKAEIKPILKSREVDFTTPKGRTHYRYEDLAQIATQVDPILAKYGLSYRHRSKQEGKRLSVTCILAHRDGHFEETTLAADNDESGNKNSIQAIGSVATYLQRYTLKLALGLSASKDDDAMGSQEVETITEEQATELKNLILNGRTDEDGKILGNALRYMKVEDLTEIPAKSFDAIKKQIESVNSARARAAK